MLRQNHTIALLENKKNRTITGIEIQKASGGGKDKYLKIDIKIFKTCLRNFHVDIDQMDIDNNDNNDDNDYNNGYNNDNIDERPTKKARAGYSQKHVEKTYLTYMKKDIDSMKTR